MTASNHEDLQRDRASYRMKAELRVYYGNTPGITLSGFSVDMSSGGLFLKSCILPEVGEQLRLDFALPDEQRSFHCNARVAWVNGEEAPEKPELPTGFGVQFVDMPLDAIKAIQRFIKHNIIEPRW